MRRSVITAISSAAAVVAVGLGILVLRDRDDRADDVEPIPVLASQSATSGAIAFAVEPRRVDASGAVFAITLDTHSEELAADMTRAKLSVGGAAWSDPTWTGDAPGGHHREGELSFAPGGAASGTVVLVLEDFSEPVEFVWSPEEPS